MRARIAASSGRFALNREISICDTTVWWGWEDSNFQPNDYQPPALSIEHSGEVRLKAWSETAVNAQEDRASGAAAATTPPVNQ
jgi:hypothetical protein